MTKKTVSLLSEELLKLGLKNDDYRSGEPILNIIDCELYCVRISHNQLVKSIRSDIKSEKALSKMECDKLVNVQWFEYAKKMMDTKKASLSYDALSYIFSDSDGGDTEQTPDFSDSYFDPGL